ncbi:MAG: cysteine synthase [Planctomycetes bacterium]|nr:cysteine synthase [Planctomycetota bacterium]MCB9909722.1 cysteine synthase [Planctomycetota bacterium]MCB9911788.1 cysteine synthase [Planctomycetota bacterium]
MNNQDKQLAQVMDLFTTLLDERRSQERLEPIAPAVPPEVLLDELSLELPVQGLSLDGVAARLRAVIEATPSTAPGRFYNQLFGGRETFAVLGDVLASALNNSMYTFKVAGPQVLLENELIERMGKLMGYQDHEGTFTPGGSLSNLCAMVVARDHAFPEFREQGMNGSKLRVYMSTHAHYSVPKAAAILGIGRANIVRIPVDKRGRMLAPALARAIDEDVEAGYLPLMVNATAGTTVLGAFDPIEQLADICESRNLWLHLDGAFGATLVFDERFQAEFAGSERVDSITWDAHKLMGVPLSCSVLLLRERGRLQASFDEVAGYLFQTEDDHWNPGTRSIQCGRRNDALKLWTNWLHHGTAGYRARTERMRDLALLAADCVREAPELTLVKEPESLTVCFTAEGAPAESLCEALQDAGLAMVGHATVEGESVVRLALVDPGTQKEQVRCFFEDVRDVMRSRAIA